MPRQKNLKASSAVAVIAAASLLINAAAAAAQSSQDGYGQPPPPPQGQYAPQGAPGEPAPPQGQYAPPPPGYEGNGAVYDDRAQQYDRDYADRYSRWAAQYCVDRRNNNTAAGAVIGGVLGAVLGGGLSGRYDRGAGVVVGAGLGATAGAAIGSSSTNSANCPPGYYLRSGASPFAYDGPYPATVIYGPSWYQPWVFVNGAWVYRPYRYWYWNHPGYWGPGYHPGAWHYGYRRW